jgi:hypothetical protein
MTEAEALTAIDKAAEHAASAFRRAGGFAPVHLSWQDLRQAARLAAIMAMQRADTSYTPNEREAYLARCALGGIQDACWRTRAAGRALNAAGPATELTEPAHWDTPESWAIVAQACEAIAAMPHPFPLIVRLTLTGATSSEIAKALNLTTGRIAQLRGELAGKLNKYLKGIPT